METITKNAYDHRAVRQAEVNARELLRDNPITILDDLRPIQEIAGQFFVKGMAALTGVPVEPVVLESHQVLKESERTL